jgi:hypothetical protein
MASVLMATKCNKCERKYPEMWLDRDGRGFPIFEGVVCGACGAKCMARDWNAQEVQVINVPLEDGNINRMEYSYVNENGKTINKKLDPKMVERHFKRGGK